MKTVLVIKTLKPKTNELLILRKLKKVIGVENISIDFLKSVIEIEHSSHNAIENVKIVLREMDIN